MPFPHSSTHHSAFVLPHLCKWYQQPLRFSTKKPRSHLSFFPFPHSYLLSFLLNVASLYLFLPKLFILFCQILGHRIQDHNLSHNSHLWNNSFKIFSLLEKNLGRRTRRNRKKQMKEDHKISRNLRCAKRHMELHPIFLSSYFH